MIKILIVFFESIFGSIFITPISAKIKNHLDKRNLERSLEHCADNASQTLENYYLNEKITKKKVDFILSEIRSVIYKSKIDAEQLALVSLDEEKLVDYILSEYPISESIKEEGLDGPYRMTLKITASILCDIGPSFKDWEKESWRRNFKAFDKVIKNQEEILELIGPGGKGSVSDRFINTYKSHILRRFSIIDASTLSFIPGLLLELSNIFIKPYVSVIPEVEKDIVENVNQKDDYFSIEITKKEYEGLDYDYGFFKRIRAEDFISQYSRCAIVGLPGSGKTTLLKHILLAIIRNNIDLGNVVPVYIRVRDLDLDNLPGAENIIEVAQGQVFGDADKGFLDKKLGNGEVLLLIDGLDEANPEKYENLLNWISDLIEVYPFARYIISSRPSNYQSSKFKELDFRESILDSFNKDQIKEYVEKWSKAIPTLEGKDEEEVLIESSIFTKSLLNQCNNNPYIYRIASNPLLLSTLCLIQKYEGGNLPESRINLYRRCVEGLLFIWDNKRKIPLEISGLLSLNKKITILSRLAIKMQAKNKVEIDEDDLLDSFKLSLEEIGETESPDSILSNIRDRSGLLIERRPKVYSFSHLTFQEYFSANAINEVYFKKYDRLFLFSKREDPQWHEVITLYSGLTSSDLAGSLIKELIDNDLILLAAKCIISKSSIELNIQKELIIKIFLLEKVKTNVKIFNIFKILGTFNQKIVQDCALNLIKNSNSFNPIFYLMKKKNPKMINTLYEKGINILKGEKEATKYDFLVIIGLLNDGSSQATKALGELAKVAEEETKAFKRSNIFSGVWNIGEGLRLGVDILGKVDVEKFVEKCTLKHLRSSSLNEAVISMLKFLKVSSSKAVIEPIIKETKRSRKVGKSIGDIQNTLNNIIREVENVNEKFSTSDSKDLISDTLNMMKTFKNRLTRIVDSIMKKVRFKVL